MDKDVAAGERYLYELAVRENGGSIRRLGSREVVYHGPAGLRLCQNVPNPFNPTTTISFTLLGRAHAKLSIYDVDGRLVVTLVDEIVKDGFNEVTWDGNDACGNSVSSGVYFYRLIAGDFEATRKMVLLR